MLTWTGTECGECCAGIQTESSSLGNDLGNDAGNYGSYGSAQGMGSFANQHSGYSQPPGQQYQSYGGESSTGTPSTAAPANKQPAFDSYSNYNSFAQPSFSHKPESNSSYASQPPSQVGSWLCVCFCLRLGML